MPQESCRLEGWRTGTHCGGRQLGLLPLLVEEARELVTALEHIAAGLVEGAAVVPDEADVVCYRACARVEVALQTLGDRSQVHWILWHRRIMNYTYNLTAERAPLAWATTGLS